MLGQCYVALVHKSALKTEIEGYTRWEDCFLVDLKTREMVYPAPTKGFHGQA